MCMYKPNKANYAQRITVEQNIDIYKVCFIGYKNDNIIIYKGDCDATGGDVLNMFPSCFLTLPPSNKTQTTTIPFERPSRL